MSSRTPRGIMALAGALAVTCAAACSDGTTTTDARTDTTTDVAGEETTLPAECQAAFDPKNPMLKMSYFDIKTPENLNNPALENLMLTGFDSGDFIWLFEFTGVDDGTTDTDGTFHMYTESGLVEAGDPRTTTCYKYMNDAKYPGTQADVSIAGSTLSWPSVQAAINITVPLYKTDGGVRKLLLALPLTQVKFTTGTFSADRKTIGSESACGADLVGLLTVDDAKSVSIAEMGLTLCGLLSGDKGSNLSDPADDCQKPVGQWPTPPDTEYSGKPAYSVTACFSAKEVRIKK